MGYTTNFEGTFLLDRPLAPEHRRYLSKFSETRRMRRNEARTATRPDPIREAAGLPVGLDGGYFVGAKEYAGQEDSPDILAYNDSPRGQPGLWCKWEPTDEDEIPGIRWSGAEKFYDYTEWLEYLIQHFLKPWGYTLNGKVAWEGEDSSDSGILHVKNNVVRAVPDVRIRPEPYWGDDETPELAEAPKAILGNFDE